MASKAFFRCRSCGESLRTEALHCPFCGATRPTAAEPRNRDEAAHGAQETEEAVVPFGAPDRRFPSEAKADLGIRNDGRREPRLTDSSNASGTGEEPSLRLNGPSTGFDSHSGENASVRPSMEPSRHDLSVVGAQRLPAVTDRTGPEATGSGDAGALAMAPEAVGASVPGRKKRAIGLLARLSRVTALVLIVVGVLGATRWWMENNNLPDLGLDPATQQAAEDRVGEPRVIEAADDWVVLTAEQEAMQGDVLLDASGPFRLRIDGEVFTVSGQRTIRVPLSSERVVEVKAIRAPTRVEVTPGAAD